MLNTLNIPQKLYGRDTQLALLEENFERVRQGSACFLLISGPLGIGKTSLVNEFSTVIAGKGGSFASARFERLQSHIPYSALIDVLKALISKILKEDIETQESWKSKLLEGLGVNGQLMIDLIPDLELLIGPQRHVLPLIGENAELRFHDVFRHFVSSLTSAKEPLVLFLDNLQWADHASLQFINSLATTPMFHYLLLIGAYDDYKEGVSDFFVSTLESIEKNRGFLDRIVLEPLPQNHIGRLLSETLNYMEEEVQFLAQSLMEQTQGNPLLLVMLLQILNTQQIIFFDPSSGKWLWDADKLGQIKRADSVIEFVLDRIKQCSSQAQSILKVAAIQGYHFSLDLIASTLNITMVSLAGDLVQLFSSHLIIQSDTKGQNESRSIQFEFFHDCVQQAAYTLMSRCEAGQWHLAVGNLCRQSGANVYASLAHFNQGLDLITDSLEKIGIAKLNVEAAKKARLCNAFHSALYYVVCGFELLPDESWHSQHLLIYDLFIEYSLSQYFTIHDEHEKKYRNKIWRKIKKNFHKLIFLKTLCPDRLMHKHILISAELARILKHHEQAAFLYDQAVQSANIQGLIEDEAVACELRGKYYLRQGKDSLARISMQEAHYSYYCSFAMKKMKEIEEKMNDQVLNTIREQSETEDEADQREVQAHVDLEAVMQASQALSQELILENLLAKLIEIVSAFAGAEKAVFIMHHEGQWMIKAGKSLFHEQTIHYAQPYSIEQGSDLLPLSIVQFVIHTKETALFQDVYHEKHFTEDPYVEKCRLKSVLCIPLIYQGHFAAVLYLENNMVSNAFTQDRVELLSLLCSQVVTSLENALLYEKLKFYSEGLEKLVNERTQELNSKNKDLSNALTHLTIMQKQVLQQEKLAALGTLSRGIAHELKNPLNFINNFAILSDELVQDLEMTLKKSLKNAEKVDVEHTHDEINLIKTQLKSIVHYGERADSIVNALLEHAQTTQRAFELVDINNFIEANVHVIQGKYLKKEDPIPVLVDYAFDATVGSIGINSQSMTRVLQNLLDNAFYFAVIKASKKHPDYTAKVSITTKNGSEFIEIQIKDNGIGINKANIDKIFLPFFTTKPTGTGIGLGLTISHDIVVQEHGGTLTVKSEEGEFTEAVITLPKVHAP